MPEERWIIQRGQGVYPIIAGVVDMLRIMQLSRDSTSERVSTVGKRFVLCARCSVSLNSRSSSSSRTSR